jgi:hypothetical protein
MMLDVIRRRDTRGCRQGTRDVAFPEALSLAVIVVGVAALSRSHLIADEDGPPSGAAVGYRPKDHRERVRQ